MTQYSETLKAIMAAALAPDVERFVDFLTDDVEYHFHVSTPPVRGKEGVRRFMAKYRTIAADPLWRAACSSKATRSTRTSAPATASRIPTWASWSSATARSRSGAIISR